MGRWPLYHSLHTVPLVSSAFSGSNPQWRILQSPANCCKKRLQSWELFLDHHNCLSLWVKPLPGSTFHGTKQFSTISMVLYEHTNIENLLAILLKMLFQNLHREFLQEKEHHCTFPCLQNHQVLWGTCSMDHFVGTGNSADTSLCQDLMGKIGL